MYPDYKGDEFVLLLIQKTPFIYHIPSPPFLIALHRHDTNITRFTGFTGYCDDEIASHFTADKVMETVQLWCPVIIKFYDYAVFYCKGSFCFCQKIK